MTVAVQILTLSSVLALAIAAMSDVASRRVPNWTCLFIVVCGLTTRIGMGDVFPALLVAAAVFAVLFSFWTRGWLGGGDVKLLAACTLLVPPGVVPTLVLTVAMAGGVLGLGYLVGRLRRPPTTFLAPPLSVLGRVCRVEAWRIRRRAPLPYACAIAAGCVFTLATG